MSNRMYAHVNERSILQNFMTDKTVNNKMPVVLLRYRPWFIGLFQAWLTVCSIILAWLLRFDFTLPYRQTLLSAIPILVLTRLVTIAYFGLLRGWWKYTG